MTALGLTNVRSLMVAWAVSAIVLVVGLVILLTGGSKTGFVVFVLGAAGSLMTAFFMLRLRANVPRRRTPE